jgi:LemA protein
MAVILIGSILLGLGGTCWVYFTQVVSSRKRMDEAWRELEDQLDKRHELLGPLVEGTKSNQAFEKAIVEIVSSFRGASADDSSDDLASAESRFSRQLRSILCLGAKFPEMDAIGGFNTFQKDLVRVEMSVQAARKHYNNCVKVYNGLLGKFPTNVIAQKIEYRREKSFEMQFAIDFKPSASD